jgi:hypothetical protein
MRAVLHPQKPTSRGPKKNVESRTGPDGKRTGPNTKIVSEWRRPAVEKTSPERRLKMQSAFRSAIKGEFSLLEIGSAAESEIAF